jgi:arginine N-succinyltransferase
MAPMSSPPPVRIRPVRLDDLDALMVLAEGAGTGFTNLPADRAILSQRIEHSLELLHAPTIGGAIMLGLEIDGRVRGCGMVFPRIGVDWPFYSYRIGYMTQRSSIDGRMVRFKVLTLTNDLEDCAEVGGLIVDPSLRGGGYGRMMARSRYMFIACHRASFGKRVIADLRGWLDQGRSPFWDAVGGRFYQMDFAEADHINGTTGNQFIADLGPRAPIYANMLSEEAQAAIGKVHDDGRPAQSLLIEEGFRDEGYVDIFDAGPTMIAAIDELRAIRELRHAMFAGADDGDTLRDHLVAHGSGIDFCCTVGAVEAAGGQARIDRQAAALLGVSEGDRMSYLAL